MWVNILVYDFVLFCLNIFSNNCIFVTKKTMPECLLYCCYTHVILWVLQTLIMPSSILMTKQIGIHILNLLSSPGYLVLLISLKLYAICILHKFNFREVKGRELENKNRSWGNVGSLQSNLTIVLVYTWPSARKYLNEELFLADGFKGLETRTPWMNVKCLQWFNHCIPSQRLSFVA